MTQVVADMLGMRNHIPKWKTAPVPSQWAIRKVLRLSGAALAALRELVSVLLDEPTPTGKAEPHESPSTLGSEAAPV